MSIEEREENREYGEYGEYGENEVRSELMRAGVRARVARLAHTSAAGARRWSSPVLLAVLSAGAFGGFWDPKSATAGAALLGAATAVGGNMLTDIVKAGIARLGENGGDGEPSRQGLETELERRIQQILEGGGQEAEELRAEIAHLLKEVGAVGAAIEATIQAGDRDLQEQLARGLAGLGREFAEFGFTLAAVEDRLQVLRDGQDAQGAQLGVVVGLQYRQATDIRLLLQMVSDLPRHHPDAPGAGRVRWSDGCPYRGLAPFTEADAEVFYGREVLAAQLVTTVSRRLSFPGMVVVTGASGAGKSSLLRAGLLPAVGRGELTAAARDWPVLVLEPTGSPLTRLAGALAALAGVPAPDVVRSLREEPAQALLVRQAVEADARRRTLSASAAAGGRLVLVVDQFEEIFTLTPETGEQATQAVAEREAFITALHAAATVPCGPGGAPAALVVVAVRGDFVDRCAAHPHLAAALQDGPFVVGPMRETDLRRVVTGPADAAGLTIEPGLVDVILSELRAPGGGCEAGVLPLLSQTMLTVWEHREGDRLTGRGYARTGGVTHAVATSAETAYTDLAPDRQETARRVFEQLTAVTGDDVLARRTVERTALHTGRPEGGRAAVEEVLEVFARRRLIVVDAGRVQISHDVLLSSWPRLRAWLADERADRALHTEILQDAAEWEQRGRDASFLYRGVRLEAAQEAAARWRADPGRYAAFDLPGPAAAFLHAGTRAATRTRRRRQLRFTVLAGLLVVSIITAVAAVRSSQDAVRSSQDANQQRVLAASRGAAAYSQALPGDPETSARLAAAAQAIAPTDEARVSMAALLGQPARAVLTGHTDEVNSVAFSPDGKLLASSGDDGTVRIWDATTHKQIGDPLIGHTTRVWSVAFSPDSKLLASGQEDGQVRVWNATTHEQVGDPLISKFASVFSVAFSPDGKLLASSGDDEDSTVRIWNATTHQQIGKPLTGHTNAVQSVAFSPDSKLLATSGEDGTVRIWNATTHQQIGNPLIDHTDTMFSVAFSPDGKLLATGGDDENSTVRIWNATTHQQIGKPLTGHTNTVRSVAFSPDSTRLATSGEDGTVRIWNATTHQQIGNPLIGHTNAVFSVAFSPDGTRLASAGWDRTVRIWDAAIGRKSLHPLIGHTNTVRSVAFSPDSKLLATSGEDGTVRIWNATTHQQIGNPLIDHTDTMPSVAFSPDSTRLAASGDNGTVWIWDAVTREQIWNATADSQIRDPYTGQINAVQSIAFSRGGKRLAAGGGDGTVRVWDAVTRKQIWNAAAGSQIPDPFTGYADKVLSVAFSPDGTRLASAGDDSKIRIWSADTGKQIGDPLIGHTGAVQSVAFSPDGTRLASAGDDSTVQIWDVALPRDLLRAVCDLAGRSFTQQEWQQYIPTEPYQPNCPTVR